MVRKAKVMKNRIIAHSFITARCKDPDCGLHLIALDKRDAPICELVIARQNFDVVIEALLNIQNERASRPS